MNLAFFNLGGYGHFVWPSFIFTFSLCFFLYVKTRKRLTKYEKIFSKKFKQLPLEEIENYENKEKAKKFIPEVSSI